VKTHIFYRVHKTPPLNSVLSQLNPVRFLEPAKSRPLPRTTFVEYPFQIQMIFMPMDIRTVLFP